MSIRPLQPVPALHIALEGVEKDPNQQLSGQLFQVAIGSRPVTLSSNSIVNLGKRGQDFAPRQGRF